ncbi:IS110 family transposase [Crocinitomix catalasitica]|nr:IS110 family transposase [Crocinitomix catalasitica]
MQRKEVLNQALGIDMSMDSFSTCLCDLQLDLGKEFILGEDLPNDKGGFLKLTKWLRGLSVNKEKLTIVMEATGVYHEELAHYLFEKGYRVCVMQSGRVKRYAQSLDQRSKTDALDSKMLSMLGSERKLTPWVPPSETMEELRFLSRERAALIKERTVEKNRDHANERARFTHKKAVIRFNKRMKLLNVQIQEIEKEMIQLVSEDPGLKEKVSYLESIPGVSFITSIIVVAETSGFSLFTNSKQLVSYCGYDIVLKESGTYKGQTRISKRGNKHIRAALYMPALTAIRVNPTLKPFYERLKPKKSKPIVAVVAVQRKMLCLMFSLWKNEMFYDPEYEQKKAARVKALAAQDNSRIESGIS